MVTTKEPFFVESIFEISGGVGENIGAVKRNLTGFAAKPIFDGNSADGLDVDIGGVFDSGSKVNGTKLRKFRSGKGKDGGVLVDIAGNSNVEKSADVGLDRRTGDSVVERKSIGSVDNGRIMAAGKSIERRHNRQPNGFGFAGFKTELRRRNLNPTASRPAVIEVLG